MIKTYNLSEISIGDILAREEEKINVADIVADVIANVRANVRSTMNNVSVEREDGTIENLGDKYGDLTH